MATRWQCTVCGYIHIGKEPPETCPVCGADRSQFIALEEQRPSLLRSIYATFRLHPVAAHFPNGLIPTALLFMLLSLLIDKTEFDRVAYWLILVATAVIPVSIGSGLHEWRQHFSGQRAPIFMRKIGLALLLLVLALATLVLRSGNPQLLADGGWQRWLYLGLALGMVACVTLLGHYGSLLVARLYSNLATGAVGTEDEAGGAR